MDGIKKMKSKFFTKKRIAIGVVVFVVVLLAVGGIVVAQMLDKINNPMDLFNPPATTIAATETPTIAPTLVEASPTPLQTIAPTPVPTPTPTLSPYDLLNSQADQALMKDTLNILLVGVDYADERINNPKHYVGKYFNSDVMLCLAINFKKNKVDMISVPRDSYAKIANITGIYKLNFALTAGGKFNENASNDKSFMNVCKSVQGVLGGDKIPPINYYIGVTMPVVKKLTDAIGGVDYNVDVAFTIDGRSYKKGMQHMTGQGVLDYCRVRKGALSAQPGDLNRVNRQKKILVAVFKKLQTSASILDVPRILTSLKGEVYTNMNFSQLAALAVFGKKLPENNITMRTLTGVYAYMIFNKNYLLIDQTKRVALIKEVYGVTVPPLYKYAPGYARLLWAYMQGEAWLRDINNVLIKDAKLKDKKKLIDPVKNAELTASINATRTMMNKYKSKVYKSTKPVAYSSEYTALSKQAAATKALAQSMFAAAGYKVNWFVDPYKPGQLRMKE
jgi:LCP family protein required for cell wall assembly